MAFSNRPRFQPFCNAEVVFCLKIIFLEIDVLPLGVLSIYIFNLYNFKLGVNAANELFPRCHQQPEQPELSAATDYIAFS